MNTRAIVEAPFDAPEYRKQRGPNGRRLCRWCGQEVPPRRQTWCSDPCVDEFLVRKGGPQMVARVVQRDHFICQICGLDLAAFRNLLAEAATRSHRSQVALARERMGFRATGALYDVDHIVPVSEGGGACGLDNLRCLCTPCHKSVTAMMRARQAELRRRERVVQPNLPGATS